MSIRLRITLTLLGVGLAPIILAVLLTNSASARITERAVEASKLALEQSGQATVQEKAESVAAQIQIYLQENPQINPDNAVQLQADAFLQKIAVQPVGKTGYTAVHNDSGVNYFHTNPGLVNTNLSNLQESLPEFWNIVASSLDGTPAQGYYDWSEPDGSIRQKYMAIVPVPGTPLRVAATTYIDEFSQPITNIQSNLENEAATTRSQLGLLATVGGFAAVIFAVLISMQITSSLQELTRAADRVTNGQWDAIKPLADKSELGSLSRALYSMTRQLREAVANLEEQVKDRTKEITRRNMQLEAITFIAREVARAKELNVLLDDAVRLVRDRFGFYHAGIFLTDELEEYAVLVAAAGETGRQLLESDHKLKIGETGIVGQVTKTGQARIALDVGEDAVYFKNPMLPQTRSEMALPLKAGGKVIGVLDIQAVEASAFEEEDIATMQALADQLAVAIENLQLAKHSTTTHKQAASISEDRNRQTWQDNSEQGMIAFEYNRLQVQPIDSQIPDKLRKRLEAGRAITVSANEIHENSPHQHAVLLAPIVLHDMVVGIIGLENNNPGYQWRSEEISTAEAIAGQVAIALENARLIENSQQRASHEQTISDITAKVSSSVQIENILRTTAQELGRILQNSEVLIQLQGKQN